MHDNIINVGDWIRRWAQIQPDKTAIISEDVPYSYADLNRRVNKLSHFFLHIGVKKGDRVAVLLHNCKQYAEIFFALSKIGGVLVPLNWRLTLPELEFIIKDSGSNVVIFEDEFMDNADMLRKKMHIDMNISCAVGEVNNSQAVPSWTMDYETSIASFPEFEPETSWSAGVNDPHVVMYTSGTTGLPKGAMLSHRKTFFNVLNANMFFDLTKNDIAIIGRPLFHSGGLIVEMAPVLYRGGTIIVKKRFRPREILETIQKHRVTILELPATVYNFILEECDIEKYDVSSLKCCFTGGERVPVTLLKTLAEKGLIVSQIYGLTEASTLFWLPMEMAREKMGSVGQPIFHGEVRIVDEQGKPVKSGEIGEIIVKGPIVMSGYWKRKDLTDEVIKGGWLYTGDLARVDKEGFVYIVDRKKDMFISGGENVYPAEIEKVLFSHPSILDAAVMGVEDEKWGEVGKAFIVLKDGQTLPPDDIYRYLKDKLAKYKIPKYIEFKETLPKTASGKILKRLLKENVSSYLFLSIGELHRVGPVTFGFHLSRLY